MHCTGGSTYVASNFQRPVPFAHIYTTCTPTRSISADMKLFVAITLAFAALVAAAPENIAKEAVNERSPQRSTKRNI
ncbi:hypothetical protein HBH98_161890 [Parastagonospora nodorum]|nr:hypothetical protein HBH54_177020 [Parastagonospora nodorum]KAH3976655.1 hypothetical protein HBH52_120250 [Parastagonospora nodorum]KAH3984415.1 hypothetical protein HBH51_028530 [Parastagonospora nodorum]KAH4000762.1 hypothetical protein HBI10_101310 [Parastagonospora nodorum]KAH4026597.1 hypothetical protein HBI13_064290 [Parastagonospora nodorum]